MIKEWIESYEPVNIQETEQALREIMQEISLAGLYRANFFKHAAFYEGTALRIFHGLDRFSEDLDFSLLQKDTAFEIAPYFTSIVEEFEAVGMKVQIHQKSKSTTTHIDSAFLKSDTLWSELIFENTIPQVKLTIKPSIKIKLEVDIHPPLHFQTENRLLTKPFSFFVNCFTLPDLFAGKMHALLYRNWKRRIKGRDWYDLEWYIKKEARLNLEHFAERARESGDWNEPSMSRDQLIDLLHKKIDLLDIKNLKADIIRFIRYPQQLDIWSHEYFHLLCDKLKVI